MLLRILTMHVDPAREADWMRFTRDVGFPGMLAQPGCRQIWRLKKRKRIKRERKKKKKDNK